MLIARLLSQSSLEAAEDEAKREQYVGWFTFVMADGEGRLFNVDGSPGRLVTEWGSGSMARVYYDSREMIQTPVGRPVECHLQCARMAELFGGAKGRLDSGKLQQLLGDHEFTIFKHFGSLDAMIFDTTSWQAHVTRGPGCLAQYRTFMFDD